MAQIQRCGVDWYSGVGDTSGGVWGGLGLGVHPIPISLYRLDMFTQFMGQMAGAVPHYSNTPWTIIDDRVRFSAIRHHAIGSFLGIVPIGWVYWGNFHGSSFRFEGQF